MPENTVARQVFHALIAGTMSGVVILGAGGRVAMRLLALMARRPVHFGWSATFSW
jgi:hypothetical protein